MAVYVKVADGYTNTKLDKMMWHILLKCQTTQDFKSKLSVMATTFVNMVI